MSRRVDRLAGRAVRRARRGGRSAPRLAGSAVRLREALRALGTTADDIRRTLLQIFTAPPPRGRPLNLKRRKYRR